METVSQDQNERELIDKIAKRAVAIARSRGNKKYDFLTANMDISACHLNGCPLDLERMLADNTGAFGHDVFGINRYLDHITGKLTGGFKPTFAQCSVS